jgi:ABC-type spermidine/putrescine transport system permease subunit II
MVVFSLTRLGATPEIYALATVIVAAVTVLLLSAGLLLRNRRGG